MNNWTLLTPQALKCITPLESTVLDCDLNYRLLEQLYITDCYSKGFWEWLLDSLNSDYYNISNFAIYNPGDTYASGEKIVYRDKIYTMAVGAVSTPSISNGWIFVPLFSDPLAQSVWNTALEQEIAWMVYAEMLPFRRVRDTGQGSIVPNLDLGPSASERELAQRASAARAHQDRAKRVTLENLPQIAKDKLRLPEKTGSCCSCGCGSYDGCSAYNYSPIAPFAR